jgi:2',3'-cyclic-nucleotide 2'-phosphodiesterase (5'-nucleotidase family)
MKVFLLSLVILLVACSAKNKDINNQTAKGHEELYSHPNSPDKVGSKLKRLVIAATNDVHGHYGPVTISFEDKQNKGKQEIQVGGVDYIAAYFKILKQVYGNVLLVDSGDILPAQPKDVDYARQFYNELNYDAVTVGLSDFTLPLPKGSRSLVQDFAKDSKVPVLLSNLFELKTARAVEWPGTKAYELKEINGIKVGILGIVPNDIVELTPIDNRIGLYVENMVQNTLRNARLLRSLGAQIVIVLTHQGVECGKNIAKAQKLPLTKVNFEPERSAVCDMSGVMGEYLTRLPPHLVDVIIGGRNHQKMANYYNGILLLSSFPEGRSFSYAEFFFDAKTNKLLKEQTVVKQPVMFCHEFFKETDDCYTEDPSVDHKAKVVAEFLGKEIRPDEEFKKKFAKFYSPSAASDWKPDASALKRFEADVVFFPTTAGNSQLVTVELSGKELKRSLERKFNDNRQEDWIPNPYRIEGRKLYLRVKSESIDNAKTYRILTDVKSLQHDRMLRRLIPAASTRTFTEHSWNTLAQDGDEVSQALAAPQRQ